jgi:hypothetical protein
MAASARAGRRRWWPEATKRHINHHVFTQCE